jgi:phosphoribosylformylglycinamidine synthase
MKFGVIVFPGSNCDHDAYHVVSKHVGQPVDFIWHKQTDLSGYDALIVPGEVLSIPIAHAEGNYVCDDETFQRLEENNQIVFRYCDETGETTAAANPNGSRSNIAGICNENGNVLGMMPHPERACEELLGSNDGRDIFRSLTNAISRNEQ